MSIVMMRIAFLVAVCDTDNLIVTDDALAMTIAVILNSTLIQRSVQSHVGPL